MRRGQHIRHSHRREAAQTALGRRTGLQRDAASAHVGRGPLRSHGKRRISHCLWQDKLDRRAVLIFLRQANVPAVL